MFDLDRFKRAQDGGHAGFAAALRELRAGHKTSHWIWYVFPQLSGLGRSPMAMRYGLAGPEEAAAYLRDPVLLHRLVSATAAVRAHVDVDVDVDVDVAPEQGQAARLDRVMGSNTDALKLVSSMTLFHHVADRLYADEPRPELSVLVGDTGAILAAAAHQGYRPCAFTLAQLGLAPAG